MMPIQSIEKIRKIWQKKEIKRRKLCHKMIHEMVRKKQSSRLSVRMLRSKNDSTWWVRSYYRLDLIFIILGEVTMKSAVEGFNLKYDVLLYKSD